MKIQHLRDTVIYNLLQLIEKKTGDTFSYTQTGTKYQLYKQNSNDKSYYAEFPKAISFQEFINQLNKMLHN